MNVLRVLAVAAGTSLLLYWLACGNGQHMNLSAGPGSSTAPATGTAFLYVSNAANNTISAFQIDNVNGTLRVINGSPFAAAGTAPGRAVVDPAAHFLFVINQGSASVSCYRIDPTGILTARGTAPTGAQPVAIAVHPTSSFIYVVSSTSAAISGFSFDSFCTLVPLPLSPYRLGGANGAGISIDPTGSFVFATSQAGITIFSIASDGTLTRVALPQGNAGALPAGIAADPVNQFIYSAAFGTAVGAPGRVFGFRFDGFTGVNAGLTPLPNSPVPAGINALWISITPAGAFAYVAAGGPGTGEIRAFSIGSDGFLTRVNGSPFASRPNPTQIVIDPSGSFLYAANLSPATSGTPGNVSGFVINSSTGFLTPVPGSPFAITAPNGLAIARFSQ